MTKEEATQVLKRIADQLPLVENDRQRIYRALNTLATGSGDIDDAVIVMTHVMDVALKAPYEIACEALKLLGEKPVAETKVARPRKKR